MRIKNRKDAFTMVELLVVLALMIVIAVAVIFNLGDFNTKQNLESAVNSLVAVIRDVQQRSVTQQDGQQWGIRFYNTNSDRYDVFKGVSYASGTLDKLYAFRQGIKFSEPTASSSFDILFNPLTGKTANNKIVSLVNNRGDGLVGDIILNQTGLVTSRIEKDLRGYWHLDEGTSTIAYDTAGLNHDGALTGPSWKSGANCRAGACLSFDSSENDYVVVNGNNPILGSSAFTIVGWLKIGVHSDYGLAFYIGNSSTGQSAWIGYAATAQVGASNSIGGGFYGRNYGSGITDTSGWHHVVLSFSGSASGIAKLYVDGVEKTSEAYVPDLQNTSIMMGKANSGVAYYYNGDIDEVRFYSRALTGTEILNLYNDLK